MIDLNKSLNCFNIDIDIYWDIDIDFKYIVGTALKCNLNRGLYHVKQCKGEGRL